MSISIHAQSVGAFSHGLRALSSLLDRARAHAESAGYDVAVLLDARLFPDMFALRRQVQLATDFAKGGAARLAGAEVPRWEDNEVSFEELQARIAKALDFLASLPAADFAGGEARAIELKTPRQTFNFSGEDFLLKWALPNFYFHLTTAYNLLRHNGVPVGKLDFLAVG